MDKENLGKYIQKKRKEKQLTQTDLANKLNVSTATISKWERGLNFPDITLFEPICEILDITIYELFTQTDAALCDSNGDSEKMEYFMKEVLSLVLVNNKDVVKSKRRLHKINIELLLMIIALIIFILGMQYFYKDPTFEIIDTETVQQKSSDLTPEKIYILHVFVKGYLEEQDIKKYSDYILTLWSEGEYASENLDYIRIYLYNKPEGNQNNACIAEINLLKP